MITHKLHIKYCSNNDFVATKQQNYSFAFRKLYNNIDKIKDKEFVVCLCEKYNLSSYEYLCLLKDVECKIKQIKTSKAKIEDKIVELSNDINEFMPDSKYTTKQNKKQFYKLNKKINHNNKRLSKGIVFGNKLLLNKLSKNRSEVKQEWKKSRIISCNYLGEQY